MRITREQQIRAAEDMFKKLDAKDGNDPDGKIQASVWNQFVKDIAGTGKEIKNSIGKDQALRSIRDYLARQNADEEMLKKWNEGIEGLEIEKSGKKDEPGSLNYVKPDDSKKPIEINIPRKIKLPGNTAVPEPIADKTTGPAPTGPAPIPVKKPVERKLTPEQAKEARAYGSNVSDYLVGYTTDAEEGLTRDVITKHVNKQNVMEFLKGYEDNKGKGDHFFRQLHTEHDFGDTNWNQQDAMVDVANKLLAYMKANGANQSDIKELSIMLKDHSFTIGEADKMDGLVQKYLPKDI